MELEDENKAEALVGRVACADVSRVVARGINVT